MRRADRLFQIIQILRRSGHPVTAAALAAELETSKRSVYRDIAALIGQRVPVRGEAGLGYVLEGGFDLPPLMLTSDEVEAAVLGAQWVEGHADANLARAARDLIAKIAVTVPENLRPLILDAGARTAPGWKIPPDGLDVAQACLDTVGPQDRARLSRQRGPQDRTGRLADRHRLSRCGPDADRLVRAAARFPQLPDRPCR